MTSVLYRITYIPHLINETPPYYYVGSKFNYKPGYFGSPSSRQTDWYTEGVSISTWWKSRKSDDFLFEILYSYEDISPKKLVELEYDLHRQLNVVSHFYFNKSYATLGWVSSPRTDQFKLEQSKRTLSAWESGKMEVSRTKLIEMNKRTKSKELSENWKNPSFREKMMEHLNNQVCSDQKREKCKQINLHDIEYKGKIYKGWDDLKGQTGVTAHLYKKYYLRGLDPEVNINVRSKKYLKEVKL